jgi:hypothetical protein
MSAPKRLRGDKIMNALRRAAVFVLFFGGAQAHALGVGPAADCVVEVKSYAPDWCKTNGNGVFVQNTCSRVLDIMICWELPGGGYDCGTEFNVNGGEKMAYGSCKSNGYYHVWSRYNGTMVPFPKH